MTQPKIKLFIAITAANFGISFVVLGFVMTGMYLPIFNLVQVT